jgi:cytochrome c-type biogenesis protein CcmH/NrfG
MAKVELETSDQYLSNVIKATPENLQARKVLAAARIKMREPARAIEILESVVQGADPQTMALLGSAYMLQGDLEHGQDWFNRAVESGKRTGCRGAAHPARPDAPGWLTKMVSDQ